MSNLSNNNWVPCEDGKNLPEMTLVYASEYQSQKVLIQTRRGEMFIATCVVNKYNHAIKWVSCGTGGRQMRVMSKVVAWMELPEPYKESD